jgi:hypothetical protein
MKNLKDIFFHRDFPEYLNLGLFTGLLLVLGTLFFILPKRKVSDIEKRNLTQKPKFIVDSILSGSYTSQMDLYYSDNFPFRDWFVMNKNKTEGMLGIQPEIIEHKNIDITKQNTENWAKINSALKKNEADSVETEVDSLSNKSDVNLIIVNGKAIQVFGGTDGMAKYYASVLNAYAVALGGTVNIFSVLAPSPSDLYLPQKYESMRGKEKHNINVVGNHLSAGIVHVNTYKALWKHRNEYLFFNTDHHWTGLGAYYAYREFCKAAGFAPVQPKNLEKKVIHGFLGTYYALTQDPKLAKNIDSVVYYKFPVQTKTIAHPDSGQPYKTHYLIEGARGGFSYGVFLGSDFPLMEIETNVKNGRRAVLVKNSFGNPFATYLVNHFEKIYIVDYRYYRSSVVQLVLDNNITDLVFINNVILANAKPHLQQLQLAMYYGKDTIAMEKNSIPDSFRVKNNPADTTFSGDSALIKKLKDTIPPSDAVKQKDTLTKKIETDSILMNQLDRNENN